MLFYDEFLKKLDEEKFQIDEIEKFSPEIKKVVVGLYSLTRNPASPARFLMA